MSVSNSYSGASASVDVSYDPATGLVSWARTLTTPGTDGWSAGCWIYETTGDGGGYGAVVFDVSPFSSQTASGSFPAAPGQWYRVGARVSNPALTTPPNAWYNLNPDRHVYFQVGTQQFHVTVVVPANDTDHAVNYRLMQGATVLGELTQQPGAGPIIQTFVTQNADPVYLLESVAGFDFDGVSWFESPGAVRTRAVTPSVTPQPGPGPSPTPQATAVAPTAPSPPDSATPNAPPPPATNPVPAGPAAPVWKATPPPATGPDVVTNPVFREGVDKIFGPLSEIRTNTATANSHLSAANNKLDAVRTATEANTAALQATKASVDGVKTAVDGLKVNSDALETDRKRPFDSAASLSSLQSAAGSSQSAISGAFANRLPGTSVSVTGSPAAFPEAVVDVAGTQVRLGIGTTGLADEGRAVLIAGRALILLALAVWFFRGCQDAFTAYVVGLGNAGPAGGALLGIENLAPGVAQIKHGASAAAIVAATTAAVAVIVVLVDTLANVSGVSLFALTGGWSLTGLGSAYGFLDMFFPVGAFVSLAVLRTAFGYLVAPIYLGAAALARFLHV